MATSKNGKDAAAIPTPQGTTRILGDVQAYQKDPSGFFIGLARQAPVVKIRFLSATRNIVNDAEIARHILLENHRNYSKDRRLAKVLEKGTGPVLATSDGEDWQWRRRLMQPTFKPRNIEPFAKTIVDEALHMTAQWSENESVDIAEEMKTVTMNIIGQTMFGVDFKRESSELHHAYTDFGRALIARAKQVVPIPLSVPTALNKRFLRSIQTMKSVLRPIVAQRRRSGDEHHDLLQMLLQHTGEGSESFSEDGLIHEMSAIVFAGHETTANTLTWFFYLLSQHPDVRSTVHDETDTVLEGRLPTFEDAKAVGR